MATPDIAVMGAGIFGLSIAFDCARRGANVTVVDPRGVAAGSSGGPVGALAPHTPENWNAKKQFQFESLIQAAAFWADVETISGLGSGYRRTGRLQSIADARGVALATERAAGAKAHWHDKATWRVMDPPEFWAPVTASGKVIHDTLSARIDPRRACLALAAAITQLGGVITQNPEATAGVIVWATGYEGLHDLSVALGAQVGNGVKGQALCLDFDAGPEAPQIFSDGLHIVPHDNGRVGIGSTTERDFTDPTLTDSAIDTLYQRAIAICPALHGAPIVQTWAGVRPRAKTRSPMLGRWPNRPGQFIANGGFKIGFGMAPKVASVMADLILEDLDSIPPGFRVENNI